MTIDLPRKRCTKRCKKQLHSGIEPGTAEKCLLRGLPIFRLQGGFADENGAEEEMIKSIHFKRLVEPNGGKDEYPQAVPEKQTRVQGHV
jgi:hypothetical protein